jgi:large subunit ribosomal protein L10
LNFWDRGAGFRALSESPVWNAGRGNPPAKQETKVDRTTKESLVASLKSLFEETNLLVITHQSGLSVAESTNLRRQMREAGASFKVTKNRLARLALEGTKFADLAPMFTGPTAIATSVDPVAAARIAVRFAKDNDKLVIVGGALDEEMLDVDGVKALAALPSLDELRAKIVGMVQTPATRIVQVLNAPGGQVARVLNAYAEKGEAA